MHIIVYFHALEVFIYCKFGIMEKFLLNSNKKRCRSDEETTATSNRTVKKRKYRKYDDSYLDYGFISIELDNEERPQCVLCLKILSAESMLPSKLKRHLESNHCEMSGKPRDYFERKSKELKQQKNQFSKNSSVPKNALLASYKVAFRIAKCKKPHTIAEELIVPAAMDMVNIMANESTGQLLLKIPLSNNSIKRRIEDMSEDLHDQLIESMKGEEFALQLDEATDNNRDAHLICYVKFVNGPRMTEDLLFCKDIPEGTKAQDLFKILDTFVTENLEWKNCIGVCTDGARAMSGRYTGLQALIKEKAPNAKWTHCIIHREALASKNLSPALNEVLQSVIKVVNFIKTRPLKARFFKKMCEDLGAEHTSLLFYCGSRWLSLGYVVARIFELYNEIYGFLKEEEQEDAELFVDSDFLIKLAYLVDIFEKLNILNLSLQGNNTNYLNSMDKISSFIKKLRLWRRKMNEDGGKDCFPTLHQFATSNEVNLSPEVKAVFEEHLAQLSDWFQKYFQDDAIENYRWIQDPFGAQPPPDFTCEEEESLIELSCDSTLKAKFSSTQLEEFWISLKGEYPLLSMKALRILIPFATSYLCEAGFSAVAVLKTKYRSKVAVEREMRVALTTFIPRFGRLCCEKQAHPSH